MCGSRRPRFLLLFGTQKGQAQAIAEEIAQQAEGRGLLADIFSLQDMSSFSLETERDPVVIVISTTGTGDPPDPAVKFVRSIQNKDLPGDHLCHLRYGVLALGDSEYTYFCNGGKVVDRRLQELGAKRFYDTGYADDCVGLELTVDPWIEGLWPALGAEFTARSEDPTDAKPVDANQRDACNPDIRSDGRNLDWRSDGRNLDKQSDGRNLDRRSDGGNLDTAMPPVKRENDGVMDGSVNNAIDQRVQNSARNFDEATLEAERPTLNVDAKSVAIKDATQPHFIKLEPEEHPRDLNGVMMEKLMVNGDTTAQTISQSAGNLDGAMQESSTKSQTLDVDTKSMEEVPHRPIPILESEENLRDLTGAMMEKQMVIGGVTAKIITQNVQSSAGNLKGSMPESENKSQTSNVDTKSLAMKDVNQSPNINQESEQHLRDLKASILEKPMVNGDDKSLAMKEITQRPNLKLEEHPKAAKIEKVNGETVAQTSSMQSTVRSLASGVQMLNIKDVTSDTSSLSADTLALAKTGTSQNHITEKLEMKALSLKSSNSNVEPSLVHSVPPLCQSSLTVPSLPPSYLDVLIADHEGKEHDLSSLYPEEELFRVPISQSKCLTSQGSLKRALMLELDVSHTKIDFQPGDAFRVICPNPSDEVDELLHRLGLADKRSCQISLSVRPDTKKRAASVPNFIPKDCSLQFMLTWCLEIRATPKKALLRALVECTSDAGERRRLQELCSKQGGVDYNRFVRDPALSILDLLAAFPSCSPSISLLIEHLPKLQARPYSAASSGLFLPGKLRIVFNIVEFPPCPERPMPRRGVCTGWLADQVRDPGTMPQICILGRPSTGFHLPSDSSVPLVMVGPGTGIAPFIGFLQHREKLHQQNPECVFGESWLFFGCRSHDKDYLFREELNAFVNNGTLTHLKACFSREAPSGLEETYPKYVQDALKMCSKDIVRLLTKENGCMYVCGDAKNMAKDVNDALLDIFTTELSVDKLEAMKIIASLRDRKQYLQDIWS